MELSNIIFKGDFLKTVKNLPEKWYNLSNERTVVGAKFGAKALVEKCGNVGMTCVARGAVMPPYVPPTEGRIFVDLSTGFV